MFVLKKKKKMECPLRALTFYLVWWIIEAWGCSEIPIVPFRFNFCVGFKFRDVIRGYRISVMGNQSF